jgi:hypothetical protein
MPVGGIVRLLVIANLVSAEKLVPLQGSWWLGLKWWWLLR